MSRLILVCGPTGAGKTTHSLKLAKEIGAVRFSIDPWMQTLFAADMVELDFAWMMERVERCQDQIWEVSQQLLELDGSVILDLGFTTKAQRQVFVERAASLGVEAEIHFVNASVALRKERVAKRNAEKDPAVYAFEVTSQMFQFMEPRFEKPEDSELAGKVYEVVSVRLS